MKTNHYHNTTNQSKDFVDKQIEVCKTQEDTIYNIFIARKQLSPSQAWEIYQTLTGKNTPITSIRRAISNLSKEGYLAITTRTIAGMYNKPEHIYCVNPQQTLLF